MALTSFQGSFGLTDNAGNVAATTEPSGGLAFGGATLQATDRYSTAGLTGNFTYPIVTDGFNVPMMTFKFFDAFGRNITSTPIIKLRVPNNFNVTNFSEYSRTENIFGNEMGTLANELYSQAGAENVSESGIVEEDVDTDALLKYGATAAEAFLYALQKSLGGAQGFLLSGGLNSISQVEFMGRAAVNPYAQLLYKGPQFRKYQVPVIFKPKTKDEADAAVKIIKAFKLASSPAIQDRGVTIGGTNYNLQSFVFGYPHLTAFDIDFTNSDDSKIGTKTIFESKLCAIESVAVDYGGQKMAFFEDGIPTEINLTLQLGEIAVRTLGDAIRDSNSARTIT